jgi:3-phosphoshikimate 1-carboxyvinyltransferase
MEKIKINPRKISDFQLQVPGSKSITNRVLLLAALAEGESVLRNFLHSDDTIHMRNALRELGVEITECENNLTVKGLSSKFKKPNQELYLGNAGTAVRFLSAALANCPFESTINGNERMQERPLKHLLDALNQLGAKADSVKKNGCPPIQIQGPLKGGNAKIPGNFSSQYFSALLMAMPYATHETTIEIEGELVSKPYIDITLSCMREFGVTAHNQNYQHLTIPAGQTYKNRDYTIEGDASSATYFWGLGALKGVKAQITNLNKNSIQGDINFLKVLEQMGVEVGFETDSLWSKGKLDTKANPILKGLGKIDLNHIPDAAMTVCVLAAFADGETEIVNIDNLRIKESNRIEALTTELQKIGVTAHETKEGIYLAGKPQSFQSATIKTYDDHRIAMCFAMAASIIDNIEILNPNCVNKTYPEFWRDLKKVGLGVGE